MKRLSLKIKLTMIFTLLMTGVICGVLALLFSLSSQELLSGVQSRLEQEVAGARDDIVFQNEKLKFDSDLLDLDHGVYLSVYSSDGTLLYGKIPYNFDNSFPFVDGEIRRIQGKDSEFFLMDMVFEITGYGVVDVRGITSITEAESSFSMTLRLAVILLPLLVAVTAILGYFMAGKTLKPVKKMTDTVRSIQKDGNLSRRIHLGEGKDEIYHLAATFDQLLEKIEESMKREQQFTSDVAHELRTPLSAMMLQCEDLLMEPSLGENVREGLEVLYGKIRYLNQIISQLLMLSRADQGRAKIIREQVDFSELTQMAVEEAEERAQEKNISIQADISKGLTLMGDEILLIRFWMNLLNNAIAYGKYGGKIQVNLKSWGEEIAGEIRDDGIGISQEALPHIWERFYQEDASRTESSSSGLGLPMVQWIVREHGGTIHVSSKKNEGTCFYFSFPKSKKI
ncbi:MAG: HAMP domain-containing sensor histidine kinase [Oliverpabstia sp.]|nr:HAMP domain-containing sensor histidine kinase [Oliverpabstia sp.]